MVDSPTLEVPIWLNSKYRDPRVTDAQLAAVLETLAASGRLEGCTQLDWLLAQDVALAVLDRDGEARSGGFETHAPDAAQAAQRQQEGQPMKHIEQEIERLQHALTRGAADPCFGEICAAKQALAWALDPGSTRAPNACFTDTHPS